MVAAGFSAWANVTCDDAFPSIALSSTSAISCAKPEYNLEGPNANAIIFRGYDWPHDPLAVALTTVSFDVETGQLFDADIEINTLARTNFESGLDSLIAHEAGHVLGLDHSQDDAALMSELYFPFAVGSGPVLTSDDQAGICRVYPPDRNTTSRCDFEPDGGFAPECGGDIEGSCSITSIESRGDSPLTLLALLACALIRRRSLQRPTAVR